MRTMTALRRRVPYFLCSVAAYILALMMLSQIASWLQMRSVTESNLILLMFQILVLFSFAVGFAGRLTATAVTFVLAVGLLTGPATASEWILLLCAVGIMLLGTGRDSAWQPGEQVYSRVFGSQQRGRAR